MRASIDAILEAAVNAGEGAVKQATAAGSAALAGHLEAAETQLKTARLSLSGATRSAARAKMGADVGDPKEEWKECRVSIDRFDKLLVDLRKTGFGFITAIVSGAAFLLGPTTPVSTASTPPQAAVTSGPLVKLATFGIIALLIVALFAIDRVHQIWLNTAVDRAKVLEGLLDYKLTQTLSNQLRRHDAVLIGIVVYIVLLAISGGIFVISLETLQAGSWVWNVYQYRVIGGGLSGTPLDYNDCFVCPFQRYCFLGRHYRPLALACRPVGVAGGSRFQSFAQGDKWNFCLTAGPR